MTSETSVLGGTRKGWRYVGGTRHKSVVREAVRTGAVLTPRMAPKGCLSPRKWRYVGWYVPRYGRVKRWRRYARYDGPIGPYRVPPRHPMPVLTTLSGFKKGRG